MIPIEIISTGTSWGTVGTSGIAMMGIGSALGIPAPITAGAVLSGAYFGDKLSPLSDSCVLSAAMADIDVIDHVRGILPVSLSAFGKEKYLPVSAHKNTHFCHLV